MVNECSNYAERPSKSLNETVVNLIDSQFDFKTPPALCAGNVWIRSVAGAPRSTFEYKFSSAGL